MDLAHEQKEEAAELLQALTKHPRAVITAGPGIGKTFLFRHLCLLLTDPALGSDKSLGFEPSVPVLVSLRKFGPWLRRWRAEKKETAPDLTALWKFLDEEWHERHRDLAAGMGDWMDANFGVDIRVTFLFDGLDEVPIDGGDREWLSGLLMELESRYPNLSIYVTCRGKIVRQRKPSMGALAA